MSGRLRRIIDYLSATANEIAIDNSLLRLSGLSVETTGHIPRVPKWAALARRSPRFVRLAAYCATLFWLSGGGYLYLFAEFLPFWLRARRKSRYSAVVPARSYAIALSTRAGDVINKRVMPDVPDVWLTMPWAPLRRLPDGAAALNVFDLLTSSDLVSALRDAMVALRRLRRRPATKAWALQGYTAFRWFVVSAAVDKLPGDLVMAEHFDRWAVLVDRSAGRRSLGRRRRLALVQHGSVAGLDTAGGSQYGLPDLPARLQNVSRLFVYGSEDEHVFRRFVLDGLDRHGELAVTYFKPRIDLHPTAEGRLRLLFVGHQMCEEFQALLYAKLVREADFDCYYKPHPLAPMSRAMADVGWTVIDEPDRFPKVDLLISYPSTLVVEYDALGISAVVHPLSADANSAERLLREVISALDLSADSALA